MADGAVLQLVSQPPVSLPKANIHLAVPAPRPHHWHHAPLPKSHPKSPGQDPPGLCVGMLDQSQSGGGTGNQQRARTRVALQPSSPFKAKQVGKQQPNA